MMQAMVAGEVARKLLRLVAKEVGLVVTMMAVTLVIVTIETGELGTGVRVASLAGPLKAAVAAGYHRLVGG